MLLAALMIGACAPPGTAPTGISTPQGTATITTVLDGDTLEAVTPDGAVTIRLAAINAPEKGECYSDEAWRHLAGDEGSVTALEVVGSDQFDRSLAHVFVDRRHLNLEMVADGLAIASTPEVGDVYGDEILAAEQRAYEETLGLWNPAACGASTRPVAVAIDVEASSPDPAGPDGENLEAEMITLVNEGLVDVDVSGWIIRDESSRNRYTFPAGVVLPAGGRISITSADPGWSPGGTPVWNNDGDMALVEDHLGTVVSRWRY